MKKEKLILKLQKRKLTVYHVYSKLIKKINDKSIIRIVRPIAEQKLKDYKLLKSITLREVKPNKLLISFYLLASKLFGISFSLKLMERSESKCVGYVSRSVKSNEVNNLEKACTKYEKQLEKVNDTRIKYAGAIVLGLNDALVELTGALAGLTLALQNTRLIAVTGLITGFAASLSMAASGYLSSREYHQSKDGINPLTAAFYTGIAYIITVLLLVMPYFVLTNHFAALSIMLILALGIICSYTYYISVAKNLRFWHRFSEMAVISLTIAVISFAVGWVLKKVVGI